MHPANSRGSSVCSGELELSTFRKMDQANRNRIAFTLYKGFDIKDESALVAIGGLVPSKEDSCELACPIVKASAPP